MKIDRRGFFGALGLGALAAKLSGGTTASAPASPEPLVVVARGIRNPGDMRYLARMRGVPVGFTASPAVEGKVSVALTDGPYLRVGMYEAAEHLEEGTLVTVTPDGRVARAY